MAGRSGTVVAILTGANFLSVTGFTFLAPLLVELARELETSVAVAAQLSAATSIPWSLAVPLVGPLSDRYGRRPVILTGALVMGLSTFAAAFATDVPTLVLLRFLTGCGGAAMSPTLLATIGDLFHGPERTRAFGWVNGGFAIAALLGVPFTTALAGVTSWRVAFAVVGVATVMLAVPLGRLDYPAATSRAAGYTAGYARLLRRRETWLILASNGLERTLYAVATVYLPPFLIQRYGLSLGTLAPVLALTAVGGLIGNLGGGRATSLTAPAKLLGGCQLVAGALAFAVLGFTPPLAVAAVVIFAFAAINAYSRPPLLTLITDLDPAARGSMLGVLAMSNQGGFTLGAAIGGLALAFADYGGVGFFAGGLGIGAALFAFALQRAVTTSRHVSAS